MTGHEIEGSRKRGKDWQVQRTRATASPVAEMTNETGSAVLMPVCGREYWIEAFTVRCMDP